MTAAWTHAQLSESELAFLDALPLPHQDGSLLLVHACAHEPEHWHYVHDARGAAASLDAAVSLSPDIRYVFGGHVHEQTLYYQGRGHDLVQFMPTPDVAIWLPSQLTFVRVPYDHGAAAAAIRASGLPDFYADRLARGE